MIHNFLGEIYRSTIPTHNTTTSVLVLIKITSKRSCQKAPLKKVRNFWFIKKVQTAKSFEIANPSNQKLIGRFPIFLMNSPLSSQSNSFDGILLTAFEEAGILLVGTGLETHLPKSEFSIVLDSGVD